MNFNKEIQKLKFENFTSTPDASKVEVIEEVVASLLQKRAEFLESTGELQGEGFFPKYYVFNNITKHTDDDCFVLDPKNSSVDMESIEFYAERTENRALGDSLNNWLYCHRNLTCPYHVRENCPIVGYNLCCGCCDNRDVCFMESNKHLCDKVASDLFTTIEECDGQ